MTTYADLKKLAPMFSEWEWAPPREPGLLRVHGYHPNRPGATKDLPRGEYEVLVEGFGPGADRTPRYVRTDNFRPGGGLRPHIPDLIRAR